MKYSLLLLSCMTLCYAEETDGLIAEENGKIFTLSGKTPPKDVDVVQAQSDQVTPTEIQVLDNTAPVDQTPPPPPAPAKIQKRPLSQKTMKKGKYGVFVTGDWLFWTVHEGGLEYAVAQSPNTNGSLTDAHAKTLSFDWTSGFRVGTGYHFGPDFWDVYASYTRFTPESTKHTHSDAIFPLLYYQGVYPIALVTAAHAHSSVQFNTIDLELGREIFLTRHLSLRPHFGVKGALIWQDFHVHYDNVPNAGAVVQGGARVQGHNHFKGAGLTAGFDGTWYFGQGINLFANGTAGLLYGLFGMEQSQKALTLQPPPPFLPPPPPVMDVIDLHSSLHQFSPTVQLLIGLGWDYKFCKDAFHVGLGASYEIQYWWGQNQMERFVGSTTPAYTRASEDLVFHGLTVSLRFDF
ncbi:MAG TPA: Lpg1974 family pore-forming outer membrane protein [Rhabdochlamydiaceae bacterium]|nr:Lpg1974 family pore-forming outer membrane protein [Rhabdochlamydiaceae bacterium]